MIISFYSHHNESKTSKFFGQKYGNQQGKQKPQAEERIQSLRPFPHGPLQRFAQAIALEGQKGQKVTVIASIHQPSSQALYCLNCWSVESSKIPEVFRLFDRLHFLVDGRTAYFGPVKQLEAYFSSIGYAMPDHTMPADFVMKLLLRCTPD